MISIFFFFFGSCYILPFYFVFIFKTILVIVGVLIGVAYFTLAERKIIASIQRRSGPGFVGIFGLLQPLADGLKLLFKESIFPRNSNVYLFVISPIITFMLSLGGWAMLPFCEFGVISDINIGILFLLAISSLGVYGIIISGWSSNSKYAFLGALRSTAQMISYEVSIGLILICVILCSGSLNFIDIVLSQRSIFFVIPLFPIFLMFFISSLAETNRTPFDLPEAEAELVAGYNVEYSAMGFALFFLGEYSNILVMCSLSVILFFGGWLFCGSSIVIMSVLSFAIKVLFFVFAFVLIRAIVPRYRYDQLMRLGWKVFLPLSLGWVLVISVFLLFFDVFPILI